MNENLEDFDSLVYDVAGDLSHLGPSLFGDRKENFIQQDPIMTHLSKVAPGGHLSKS